MEIHPPGTAPPDERPPLVGRERELERVQRVIAEAWGGTPRVLLLSGEAGIGKTRLLTEAMLWFSHGGGQVALGRCLDEVGMPPFLPWIELGTALGSRDIVELLLEPATDEGGNPAAKRLRLYGVVCAEIARLAAAQPLLLALDDLQWSDPASNQLLRYVALHLNGLPLLIAGTYRPAETRANDELLKTIADCDRARLLTHIPLGPLAPTASADLIARVAGSVPGEARAAIHELSGGNPFAIEEMARALVESADAHLPDPTDATGITAIIGRRVSARSIGCREALEVAALAGREIAADLIAGALGRDTEAVVRDLEEAVAAALIFPAGEPGADYAFAHDRVREAVAEAIPASRRRLHHGRIAAALARAPDHDTLAGLARLAHHLEGARQAEDAAQANERLGDATQAVGAFDDAVLAYQRAAGLRSPSPAALLLKLGDARLHAGRADAVDAYSGAERAALAVDDAAGVARALQRLGVARARREEHDLAVACLRAAEAAWAGIDGGEADLIATRTELCSVLGASLGRYEEAIAAGRAALEAAARAGARPELEARARFALAGTQIRAGDLDQGRRTLEPALTLALQAHQRDLAAEIAGTLANDAYWTGDLPASERFARWRRELGIESRDPYALRHTLPWLANVAMAHGQWDTALALIEEAETDLARIDSPEPHAFLHQLAGMVALQRGDTERAVALLEAAIAGFRAIGPGTLPWYLGVLAGAYLAAGAQTELERTVAETVAVIDALPAGTLPRAPSIAQLGLIAAETGDTEAMRRWHAELQAYRGQFHWVLIDRALGTMANELQLPEVAEQALHDAAATAARGQIVPELLLTRAERALAARSREGLASAVTELAAAGMAVPARYRPATPPTPTVRRLPAGLTEREVEVLVLVAQGMTNREIADRLSISEKTVTNHLTHVFTKADLDNRAAAVTFAHRHGLIAGQ